MSTLTDALERIENLLPKNGPATLPSLPPGLTHREVEELAKDLPFTLPREVYELYQWSAVSKENDLLETFYENPAASLFIFDGFALLSLPEAIEIYRKNNKGAAHFYRAKLDCCNPRLFLLFIHYLGEVYGSVAIDGNSDSCEVIFSHYEANERTEQYTSLTNMMLTFAEWHERGVYLEFHNIWMNYNSDILEGKITAIENDSSWESVYELEQVLWLFYQELETFESLINLERIADTLIGWLKKVPESTAKELYYRESIAMAIGFIGLKKGAV